jgi:hypothetical protein
VIAAGGLPGFCNALPSAAATAARECPRDAAARGTFIVPEHWSDAEASSPTNSPADLQPRLARRDGAFCVLQPRWADKADH